jgi:predicted transport protein
MIQVILHSDEPKVSLEDQVAQHFSGGKAVWRKTYDSLMGEINAFGDDVVVSTTNSYISLLRKDRKFGIVQVTSKRLDIGLKLDKSPISTRIEESGTWNAMVTHRIRIENPDQIDADLILWLRQSYDLIG